MTLADKDVDSKVFFYDGEVRYFCGSFLTADGMATASPQFGNRLDFLATKLDSCVMAYAVTSSCTQLCCAFDNV